MLGFMAERFLGGLIAGSDSTISEVKVRLRFGLRLGASGV